MPLIEKVLSGLGRWLGAEHGRAVRLVADRDAIAALAPEREALYGRLNGAGFLTPNEKRAAVGLGPVEGGAGGRQDGQDLAEGGRRQS